MLDRVAGVRLKTDVLVLGSGAAGVRAALAAAEAGAEVMLAAGGPFLHHGSSYASCWGFQAAWNSGIPGDGEEDHFRESVGAGLGEADERLVERLVREAPARLRELMEWGVAFRKNPDGSFVRERGCFGRAKRAFLLQDVGRFRHCLRTRVRAAGIAVLEPFRAVRLERAEGMCVGATGVTEGNTFLQITAGATVLACGGGAGLFPLSMADRGLEGAACALAWEAGAELRHLEFIQFVLGTLRPRRGGFFPLSRLRSGSPLCNRSGEDLRSRYLPDASLWERAVRSRDRHVPFSCRDESGLMDVCVALEIGSGGSVLLREGDREWEIAHFAHAFNGGVRINERAETSLPGLYAAGEAAGGMHGADRLGGNMMTAAFVFGRIAGWEAARWARSFSRPPERPSSVPYRSKKGRPEAEAHLRLLLDREVRALGVVRTGPGLKGLLERIGAWREEWEAAHRKGDVGSEAFFLFGNRAVAVERIALAALERRRSLGSHFRLDAPPEHWPRLPVGTCSPEARPCAPGSPEAESPRSSPRPVNAYNPETPERGDGIG